MAETAELDVAPDTIEATLNYIVDDGTKVFTIVASPGGSDTRSGGTPDPRRVVIHNGRPHTNDFALERNGFRFVRHDTKVTDFFDDVEPPDVGAGGSAESPSSVRILSMGNSRLSAPTIARTVQVPVPRS